MIEAIYGLCIGILYSDWSMPTLENGGFTSIGELFQNIFGMLTHIWREGQAEPTFTLSNGVDPVCLILSLILAISVSLFILRLIWSIVPRARR